MTENTKPQFECRNAMYFRANDYSGDDLIVVKEYIHQPDGQRIPNLRFIKNYKKPVYIHKEGYRNYQQKRVWKPKSEMDVYWTTETNLVDTIKRALRMPLGMYMPLKQVCRSPYVYGSDISTTSLIKKMYKDKFPTAVSNASVAVIDIETNVKSARGEIIAISLTFKNKAIIATTKDFIGTMVAPVETFYKKLDEITPEVRKPYEDIIVIEKGKEVKKRINRQCEVEFIIAPTPARAIIEVFKRAHEWKPDFITGWNIMGFDIPRIVSDLEYEGYNPADVLSDPSVEKRFRNYRYHGGPTVSPRGVPYAGYEQWHWVNVPASFFFIDAMCLFYQVRRGGPLEENYKLETILQKYIGRGKVGIKEADHLDGIDLHRFMQEKYKIEYLVYNLFDCIGVEILDETTKDICQTFPILAGVSDFGNYTSNPKRLADALHFFVQENMEFNGVLGTASDQLKTDLDKYVPSLDGWIVALATERLLETGLDNIKEIPGIYTKMHGASSDIDISAGYPNIEITTNMSKDTTVHELTAIEGLTNEEQRVIGLNILGGKVNSIGVATKLFRLPQPRTMYEAYLASQQQ